MSLIGLAGPREQSDWRTGEHKQREQMNSEGGLWTSAGLSGLSAFPHCVLVGKETVTLWHGQQWIVAWSGGRAGGGKVHCWQSTELANNAGSWLNTIATGSSASEIELASVLRCNVSDKQNYFNNFKCLNLDHLNFEGFAFEKRSFGCIRNSNSPMSSASPSLGR